MRDKITTVELTSKPIKAALAISGLAFAIAFCGFVYSLGETDMSTAHWFVGTVITGVVYMVCRTMRWWEHG